MKIASAIALTGLLMGTAAYADTDNMIGASTDNGKVVAAWLDLAFNQHKMGEAFDKYVSRDNYVNHTVYSESTKVNKTWDEERASEIKAVPPGAKFEIEQIFTQGDLVCAHVHAWAAPNTPGDEIIEIMRVKNGKIVDHWDVHASLKDDSKVFVDLNR